MLDIKANDKIQHSSFGIGVVLDILTESAARVQFDESGVLTISTDLRHKIVSVNGNPPQVFRKAVRSKSSGILYTTDYERAVRPWTLVWSESVAWIVGFAAQNNAFLRWSGQFDKATLAEDSNPSEVFEEGTASHGEKFDVIIPNPNFAGLDDALDINFISRGSTATVSLNKEGFFRFLKSLGFEVGKGVEQDKTSIRTRVPQEYSAAFDAGARGMKI